MSTCPRAIRRTCNGRLPGWGETVGAATAEVIRMILDSSLIRRWDIAPASESCVWLKTYSEQRLEAASQRALQLQAAPIPVCAPS